MDKKVYQKIQRYEDDKRFLHKLYLEDNKNRDDQHSKINLEFQSDQARIQFEKSIPDYVLQDEKKEQKNEGQIFNVESGEENNENFPDKLIQISSAIEQEIQLYELLRDLKKEKNQNKRLPLKRKQEFS